MLTQCVVNIWQIIVEFSHVVDGIKARNSRRLAAKHYLVFAQKLPATLFMSEVDHDLCRDFKKSLEGS